MSSLLWEKKGISLVVLKRVCFWPEIRVVQKIAQVKKKINYLCLVSHVFLAQLFLRKCLILVKVSLEPWFY